MKTEQFERLKTAGKILGIALTLLGGLVSYVTKNEYYIFGFLIVSAFINYGVIQGVLEARQQGIDNEKQE